METIMNNLATTKLSSKGQIVIPEEIRIKMGLQAGDQFVVVSDNKDTLVLKAITQPSIKEFKGLITKVRKEAKAAGVTKQSVKDAVKKARKS
jgi:AbrB family looped-hinge helix DNA binding protein